MANDIVRIQIRKNDAEHTYGDVGNKAGDESIPISGTVTVAGVATEATLEAIKDKVTEDVAQTLTYNVDGTIATMVKVVGGVTYTKTFSYTSGNVTGISEWVAS